MMTRDFGQMNIWGEIKASFKTGSALTRLIYVNLGVFVVIKLIYVAYFLLNPDGLPNQFREAAFQNKYLAYLMVPADLKLLLYRPWTIFTYMFLHFDFLHVLFNMLVLYWFGGIYQRYFTDKQILTTYLLGGLTGAALFIAFSNLLPGLSPDVPMLGASAAIMAIVIAISFYNPNYEIHLFFIGAVKIIYVALVYIVLDLIQIASDNSGGHISHLGGALYGYAFAFYIRKGKDIGKGFSNFIDRLAITFKRQPKMKVSYKSQTRNMTDQEYNQHKASEQEEMDRILDKIAKSGYDSLSKKEKEVLFKMGNKS